MRIFLTIWVGQLISLVGSGMTGFALGVWIYQASGEATPLVLVALFDSLPNFLFSPVVGALVDRINRRKLMLIADSFAALITLALFLLFSNDLLQVWHLYVAALLSSTAALFQRLAYQTSVTVLVPREQFGRANAMAQTAESVSIIVAPILGGILFVIIGIQGIFLIDFASFLIAAGILLFVRIPTPKPSGQVRQSLFAEIREGFVFLRGRGGLVSLAVFIMVLNIFVSACGVLITPMVLSFSDPQTLGIVQSASGVGLLLGGIWASAWGGPKRKVLGICLSAFCSGVALSLTGFRQDVVWIAAGLFVFLFPITLLNSSIRAIVQAKVPVNMQGRVFSLIFTMARTGVPLAYLAAGPLADRVFEPAMRAGGAWANSWVGQLLGTGPGRGIGLMFVIGGIGVLVITSLMYGYPRMRNVEKELPDAPTEVTPEPEAATA
jgi:DHA3 family macrolide efflux protein-like MFS transporter